MYCIANIPHRTLPIMECSTLSPHTYTYAISTDTCVYQIGTHSTLYTPCVFYLGTGPHDTDTHLMLAYTAYNNDTFTVDTSVYPN